MSDMDDFLAEMAQLRASFAADMPQMLDAIEDLFTRLSADPRLDMRDELVRRVHSLAGTSETFGLSDLGQAARHLEDMLEAKRGAGLQPCTEELAQLRRLADAALSGEGSHASP